MQNRSGSVCKHKDIMLAVKSKSNENYVYNVSAAGTFRSVEKANNLIGNRTRYLPALNSHKIKLFN
jgi:hypothetical protein